MTGPPRGLPDWVMHIPDLFLTNVRGKELWEKFEAGIEETHAWCELKPDLDTNCLIVSGWYGPDREESVAAVQPMSLAIDEWRRRGYMQDR